jgi:hypothetical protein
MANTYQTSTRERVSKSTIDSRTKAAKRRLLDNQMLEFGFNFCTEVGCGASSGVYLDCAHIISVKECQESGRAELAWDVNNMKVKCRKHHQEQDGLDLKFNGK